MRVTFLLLMVSIFFICWKKRFVLVYFSLIILAISIQAKQFPREDEWTAEWHKPTTFLVYILLVCANVNTLWCKLSHVLVVEKGLIFESSISKKCFSIIPFNFTMSFDIYFQMLPTWKVLSSICWQMRITYKWIFTAFLWSFSKQDMIFWTALLVCREMNLLL